MWIREGKYQITVFDRILEDLDTKALFIVSSKGGGKTLMAQYLLSLAKDKWGGLVDVRAFDPSLAWWNSSPLKLRQRVASPYGVKNLSDCLYEVGRLDEEELKELFLFIIGGEYDDRYDGLLDDPDYLNTKPLSLPVLEEAQDILKKSGLPQRLRVWTNEGRNFKMSGIFTTQRPAEVDTRIIERCNLLVGYVEGDNNKQKIRRATSKEFMEELAKIKPHSYEFLYYNGEVYRPVKGNDLFYPTPREVYVPAPTPPPPFRDLEFDEPSLWSWLGWGLGVGVVLWFLRMLFF